jgi:hypothetical protein
VKIKKGCSIVACGSGDSWARAGITLDGLKESFVPLAPPVAGRSSRTWLYVKTAEL